MDNEVIGAIISAAASVVVAVVSKTQPEKSVETGSDSSPLRSSIRPWIATGGVLTAWFLASPGLIHNDLAWQNFILIPLVVIALALLRPIKPLMAISITLAFFATNWIAGPWSNRLAHSGMGLRIMSYRANMIGGSCEVRRNAEGGTTVMCAFPVRNGL